MFRWFGAAGHLCMWAVWCLTSQGMMQTVLPSETGDANRTETAEQCRQGVGWFWFWLNNSL